MQGFITAINNKYFLWAALVIMVGGGLWLRSWENSRANERLETYKRQVSGQLSDKERELQASRHELGVMRSQLVTQEKLKEKWKTEKEEIDKKFSDFIEEHNLQIKSMDKTIASLRQKLRGGTTNVVVETKSDKCKGIEECVVSYKWEDALKRFKLNDPNIFNEGDEIFEVEQIFKVYGEVYEQEDGSLQTRRIILREVIKNENGEYEPISGAKADIVESDFTYSNPPTIEEESKWTDIFTLRPVVLGSVNAFPNGGDIKLGLGVEFLYWNGLGVNTHTALSFQDAEEFEHRIGVSYNPTILEQELNLAIGASLGTPYANFGQEWSFNIDLLFYLW